MLNKKTFRLQVRKSPRTKQGLFLDKKILNPWFPKAKSVDNVARNHRGNSINLSHRDRILRELSRKLRGIGSLAWVNGLRDPSHIC
jgi:hypothetical protein